MNTPNFNYERTNTSSYLPTVSDLYKFLVKVNNLFPTHLSNKTNLNDFAIKLYNKTTLCVALSKNNEILSLVAGYTENLVNNMAYISVVATLPQACGQELATKQIQNFFKICKSKKIPAVHLYTSPNNFKAINLYKKLGFIKLEAENETRPLDLHLIRYI